MGSCCLFCVHSRIQPKKEQPPRLAVLRLGRLPLRQGLRLSRGGQGWTRGGSSLAWCQVRMCRIQGAFLPSPSPSFFPFPWCLGRVFLVYWFIPFFPFTPPTPLSISRSLLLLRPQRLERGWFLSMMREADLESRLVSAALVGARADGCLSAAS